MLDPRRRSCLPRRRELPGNLTNTVQVSDRSFNTAVTTQLSFHLGSDCGTSNKSGAAFAALSLQLFEQNCLFGAFGSLRQKRQAASNPDFTIFLFQKSARRHRWVQQTTPTADTCHHKTWPPELLPNSCIQGVCIVRDSMEWMAMSVVQRAVTERNFRISEEIHPPAGGLEVHHKETCLAETRHGTGRQVERGLSMGYMDFPLAAAARWKRTWRHITWSRTGSWLPWDIHHNTAAGSDQHFLDAAADKNAYLTELIARCFSRMSIKRCGRSSGMIRVSHSATEGRVLGTVGSLPGGAARAIPQVDNCHRRLGVLVLKPSTAKASAPPLGRLSFLAHVFEQ